MSLCYHCAYCANNKKKTELKQEKKNFTPHSVNLHLSERKQSQF